LGRSRKDPYSPHRGNFCHPEGGGEKKLFLIIVNVLGHPKGVGGFTSYFLLVLKVKESRITPGLTNNNVLLE
jgi:hypothetical protein